MFAPAGAEVRERHFLTQKQLKEPVLVAAWLKKNAATADKERAAQAHAFGAAEAKRGSLSGAVQWLWRERDPAAQCARAHHLG